MPDIIHWTLVDSHRTQMETRGVLSVFEFQKFSAFRFQKRREEWLLGRWTAKSLVQSLPAYQHLPLDKIEIWNTPKGAPYILLPDGSTSRNCLSFSHRDGLAFCALASGPDLKIGADLERIEPRGGNFTVDYFTQAEQMLINSHPVMNRDLLVTLIWSAKEAMLKALGVGLRWDTRQVEISDIKGLDVPAGEWQKIEVITRTTDYHWSATWQRRGEYILTLAGFNTGPANLLMVEQKL
jgi:4'-phosphopantetheinyl transferase